MKSANRIWTALAVVLLASSAVTQGGRTTDPRDTSAGGKPTVPDMGSPFCYGDGSGIDCPFRNQGAPGRGCENSLGTGGGLLWARGAADVDDDSLRFFVQGLPPNTTVLYMQSMVSVDEGMGRPFGEGLMCLGGPLVKVGSDKAWAGRSAFPPLGNKGSIAEMGRIPALGGTRYYQAFYRDHPYVATGAGLNSTNAWSEVWMP